MNTDLWHSILLSAAADGWIRWDSGWVLRADGTRVQWLDPHVCGGCLMDLYNAYINGTREGYSKPTHDRPATVAEVLAWIERRE